MELADAIIPFASVSNAAGLGERFVARLVRLIVLRSRLMLLSILASV